MKKFKALLREAIVLAVFFAVMTPLRSSVVDWNWVPSGSMKPTIMEGDLVLVNKLAFDLKLPFTTHQLSHWSDPARGDVIVCYSPKDGKRLVKRVVGLPGDVIAMHNDVLTINGLPLTYRLGATDEFNADIFETNRPLLAREKLGAVDHWVLGLPTRAAMRTFGPYTVPSNRYFLMGDSRDNSFDSRYFGTVARDQILGKATVILASFSPSHYLLPRIYRFVQPI